MPPVIEKAHIFFHDEEKLRTIFIPEACINLQGLSPEDEVLYPWKVRALGIQSRSERNEWMNLSVEQWCELLLRDVCITTMTLPSEIRLCWYAEDNDWVCSADFAFAKQEEYRAFLATHDAHTKGAMKESILLPYPGLPGIQHRPAKMGLRIPLAPRKIFPREISYVLTASLLDQHIFGIVVEAEMVQQKREWHVTIWTQTKAGFNELLRGYGNLRNPTRLLLDGQRTEEQVVAIMKSMESMGMLGLDRREAGVGSGRWSIRVNSAESVKYLKEHGLWIEGEQIKFDSIAGFWEGEGTLPPSLEEIEIENPEAIPPRYLKSIAIRYNGEGLLRKPSDVLPVIPSAAQIIVSANDVAHFNGYDAVTDMSLDGKTFVLDRERSRQQATRHESNNSHHPGNSGRAPGTSNTRVSGRFGNDGNQRQPVMGMAGAGGMVLCRGQEQRQFYRDQFGNPRDGGYHQPSNNNNPRNASAPASVNPPHPRHDARVVPPASGRKIHGLPARPQRLGEGS